jgi:hypothetical protein
MFVRFRPPRVYRTLGAELDAIAAGDKPISFFASDRAEVERGADLIPIARAAFDRGLVLTLAPRGKRRDASLDLFVHTVAQARRIGPLQALLARSPWSFALEAQLGRQLGYSPAQRAAWLAAERHARSAFGCVMFYALVPRFTGVLVHDTLAFVRPGEVVSATAFDTLAAGITMVRFAVAQPAATRLLDGERAVLLPRRWLARQQPRLSVLTRRGWVDR